MLFARSAIYICLLLLKPNFSFKLGLRMNPPISSTKVGMGKQKNSFNGFDSLKKVSVKNTDIEDGVSNIRQRAVAADKEMVVVETEDSGSDNLLWKAVILGVTFVWATNFAVIKEIYGAVPSLDPALYSAIRFVAASSVFIPTVLSDLRATTNMKDWLDMAGRSTFIGVVITLGYFGQAKGLVTSTADKAAFLCTMQVAWVALVNSIRSREWKMQTGVVIAMATIGTALLELQGVKPPTTGDLWLLLQPIGFGSGYLLLENVIKDYPDKPSQVTAFKLFGIALTCVTWALANGHTTADVLPVLSEPVALAGLAYTSLITTAGAIYAQSLAFKRVSAGDASIIITTEPIWAALVAAFLLGEFMSKGEIVGAAIIVGAGLVYEWNVVDNLLEKDSGSDE
jgi:drug/metabolite transporter (DMT)-like permease